ncbi:hypothetical protein LOK49_Contig766G00001 [Camellia lanceoleosa]|nr:hypothetical protein LOK49_Contig766G00001 [Camellia lanceoleosa]
MTFVEIANLLWYERALVFAVQKVFFNAYFMAYLASPKLVHCIVGYLQEEALNSYTEFWNDLEKAMWKTCMHQLLLLIIGNCRRNRLSEMLSQSLEDEVHHRDLNHSTSDIQCQGHELREYPAPVG